MPDLIVIGGGLAGSEAAWQAAERGVDVKLLEMRPEQNTGAHQGDALAELVCSNSLGSNLGDRAQGLLKEELRLLGSLLMECADATAIPAGGALAVDREAFASLVTERVTQHARITIIRREQKEIPPTPVVIASGPLTSDSLSQEIQHITGRSRLFFYDAIAPIVEAGSINMSVAFRASRYQRGQTDGGDYINCPMSEYEYQRFVEALLEAERIALKGFEINIEKGVRAGAGEFFEGCLPIEILARRGRNTLAFGPLRPVGLIDPHTGKKPYAVVQLRQDNLAGSLYNLVGFQTNLTFPEQRRVIRLIPGLEKAEIVRYGQMHRNTYIFSPDVLHPTLQSKKRQDLFFAGQITGVEGYVGNIATGLLAGWNAARYLRGEPLIQFPRETMIGALCEYITQASERDFQPMKANYGLLPPLEESRKLEKGERGLAYRDRSLRSIKALIEAEKTSTAH